MTSLFSAACYHNTSLRGSLVLKNNLEGVRGKKSYEGKCCAHTRWGIEQRKGNDSVSLSKHEMTEPGK